MEPALLVARGRASIVAFLAQALDDRGERYRSYRMWSEVVGAPRQGGDDMRSHYIEVPKIVRMKPGELSRTGQYLARWSLRRIVLAFSHGLVADFIDTLRTSIANAGVELLGHYEVTEASVEAAVQLLGELPRGTQAIVGLGGGKALDVAKYLASLSGLSY